MAIVKCSEDEITTVHSVVKVIAAQIINANAAATVHIVNASTDIRVIDGWCRYCLNNVGAVNRGQRVQRDELVARRPCQACAEMHVTWFVGGDVEI